MRLPTSYTQMRHVAIERTEHRRKAPASPAPTTPRMHASLYPCSSLTYDDPAWCIAGQRDGSRQRNGRERCFSRPSCGRLPHTARQGQPCPMVSEAPKGQRRGMVHLRHQGVKKGRRSPSEPPSICTCAGGTLGWWLWHCISGHWAHACVSWRAHVPTSPRASLEPRGRS